VLTLAGKLALSYWHDCIQYTYSIHGTWYVPCSTVQNHEGMRQQMKHITSRSDVGRAGSYSNSIVCDRQHNMLMCRNINVLWVGVLWHQQTYVLPMSKGGLRNTLQWPVPRGTPATHWTGQGEAHIHTELVPHSTRLCRPQATPPFLAQRRHTTSTTCTALEQICTLRIVLDSVGPTSVAGDGRATRLYMLQHTQLLAAAIMACNS
jgi:hypothetical protein